MQHGNGHIGDRPVGEFERLAVRRAGSFGLEATP